MRYTLIYMVALLSCNADLHQDLTPLFKAIAHVESKHNDQAIGKAGELGRYQITYDYWLSSGMPGKHEACKNPEYSRLVMLRYWKRFCPKALCNEDYKTLIKYHRTLDIHSNNAILYYEKVRRLL